MSPLAANRHPDLEVCMCSCQPLQPLPKKTLRRPFVAPAWPDRPALILQLHPARPWSPEVGELEQAKYTPPTAGGLLGRAGRRVG